MFLIMVSSLQTPDEKIMIKCNITFIENVIRGNKRHVGRVNLEGIGFPLSCKDGSTCTHMQMYCSILTECGTKTIYFWFSKIFQPFPTKISQ